MSVENFHQNAKSEVLCQNQQILSKLLFSDSVLKNSCNKIAKKKLSFFLFDVRLMTSFVLKKSNIYAKRPILGCFGSETEKEDWKFNSWFKWGQQYNFSSTYQFFFNYPEVFVGCFFLQKFIKSISGYP